MTVLSQTERARESSVWLDYKTVGFFLKISKEIRKAWHKSLVRAKHVSLTRPCFSLVPDLLFDCSRVLEYEKIQTFLQSSVWYKPLAPLPFPPPPQP